MYAKEKYKLFREILSKKSKIYPSRYNMKLYFLGEGKKRILRGEEDQSMPHTKTAY
jgi:hypothetical protein